MHGQDALENVVAVVEPGATLKSSRRLTGGVSADVYALELTTPEEQSKTVVVRQHGAAQRKAEHKKAEHKAVAQKEFALLDVLYRANLPVAKPLHLDTSGETLDSPYLVMAYIEGVLDIPHNKLDLYLQKMAQALVTLHNMPIADLPTLPKRLDPLPELYSYIPADSIWTPLRSYLAHCKNTTFVDSPSLLHGDFWPGNLMWRDDQLVAILDWEDAALGDPMSDLAGARIELLWEFGEAPMNSFTSLYAELRHVNTWRLSLWEVFVGLATLRFMGEWGLAAEKERHMRQKSNAFVQRAYQTLNAA